MTVSMQKKHPDVKQAFLSPVKTFAVSETLLESVPDLSQDLVISQTDIAASFFSLFHEYCKTEDRSLAPEALSFLSRLDPKEHDVRVYAHILNSTPDQLSAETQLEEQRQEDWFKRNDLNSEYVCLKCGHEYRGKGTTKIPYCNKCGSYKIKRL